MSNSGKTGRTSPNRLGALHLVGLFVAQLPISWLARLARDLEDTLARHHPKLGERLREAEGKTYRFTLTDLPIDAQIKVSQARLQVRVLGKADNSPSDVRVSGRMTSLFDLLQGERDGDALFFTRDIQTSGDTEVLLILRNALENEDIDLLELVSQRWGPLSQPAKWMLTTGGGHLDRFSRQIDDLFSLRLAPLELGLAAQGRRMGEIEKRLTRLDRMNRKGGSNEPD